MCSYMDFATLGVAAEEEAVGAELAGLEIRYLGCRFHFPFLGQHPGAEGRLIYPARRRAQTVRRPLLPFNRGLAAEAAGAAIS